MRDRRRRLMYAALVCTVTGALTGCTVDIEREDDASTRRTLADVSEVCKQTPMLPDAAHCVDVDFEGSTYRALYYPGNGDVDQTYLALPGGPGTSSLHSLHEVSVRSTYTAPNGVSSPILVLEEPWVTRPVSESCQVALNQIPQVFEDAYQSGISQDVDAAEQSGQAEQTSVFGTVTSLTARLDQDCDVYDSAWTLRRDDIQGIVGAFKSSLGIDVTVISGASYAGVLADAFDQTSIRGVVVNRPLDASITVGELSAHLEAGAQANPRIPESARGSFAGDSAALATLASSTSEVKVAEIGRASDTFWRVYGDDQVSAAWLAYWQGVCTGLPRDTNDATSDGVTKADGISLAALVHQPCDSFPQYEELHHPLPERCLVVEPNDPWVPAVRPRDGDVSPKATDVRDNDDPPYERCKQWLDSPSTW